MSPFRSVARDKADQWAPSRVRRMLRALRFSHVDPSLDDAILSISSIIDPPPQPPPDLQQPPPFDFPSLPLLGAPLPFVPPPSAAPFVDGVDATLGLNLSMDMDLDLGAWLALGGGSERSGGELAGGAGGAGGVRAEEIGLGGMGWM